MGEGVPCRELVTQMIKEGEKSSKGKTVVRETTQGRKMLPPPGMGGVREAAPPPEGPPSRAEPRSPAVRVGTTQHVS